MSLTEAAEGACMPVNQIYGLEESKALMVRFDLDVQIAPNVTQKVHTGWLSPPDDMLLREKMDDGATVAQSSQVLKTFVYREHLVIHTSIAFDRWCQGDCGCVEKGYFGNVQGLTTGGSTNFLQQGGLIAIIVILPILAVAVCLCVIHCRRLRRAKVYQAGGKGGKGKGGGGELGLSKPDEATVGRLLHSGIQKMYAACLVQMAADPRWYQRPFVYGFAKEADRPVPLVES